MPSPRTGWYCVLALFAAALIAPPAALGQAPQPGAGTARADGGPDEGTAPIVPDADGTATAPGRLCRPRNARTTSNLVLRSRLNCQIRRGGTWSKRAVQPGRGGGWSIAVRPIHGRARVSRPRTGAFAYTPTRGFVGNDRFHARLLGPGQRVYGLAMAIAVGRPKPKPPKPKPTPSGSKPACDQARFSTTSGAVLRGRLPCRGREIRVEIVRSPAHGKVRVTDPRRGTFAYTPESSTSANQRVEFSFRATNSAGSSPNRTATIQVRPANGACENVDATTTVNTPKQVKLPCKGKGLRYELTSRPGHGTATVDATTGVARYTPAAGYVTPGGSAGDRFKFRAVNDGGASPARTATVDVQPSAPRCQNADDTTTERNTQVTIKLRCTGERLRFELVDRPAHGRVELDAGRQTAVFTPERDYVTPPDGTPDRFTFRARNRAGVSSPATAKVTIVPAKPTCADADPVRTPFETAKEIDLPCQGLELKFEVVDQPANGKAEVDADSGRATYTPDSGYFTPDGKPGDRFTFRATNRVGSSETRTAEVEVLPDAPTCEDADPVTTRYRTPATVTLPCRGSEIEFEIVERPKHGRLGDIDPDSGEVRYTPDDDYFTATGAEPDEFTFTAANRGGKAEPRTAKVTVEPPAPTCEAAEPVTTAYRTEVEITLRCDGDAPRYAIVDQPGHGTLGDIDQQTAKVTYTPADDYYTPADGEPDRFTFRASNRGGDSDPAAATITVLPPEPTCEDAKPVTTAFETAVKVDLPCDGVDIERIEVVDQPKDGALGDVDLDTKSVQYTPNDGFFTKQGEDPDSFTFRAINRAGRSETRTARVTTQPDVPTCEDAAPAQTANRTAVEIELRCKGVDFKRTIVDQPEHGKLGDIDQSTGKVSYTPADDYYTPKDGPPDRFTFRATNRGGDGRTAVATVTVLPPQPTCEDAKPVTTAFETAVKVDLPCDGVDIERIEIVAGPKDGRLGDVDQGAKSVQYTPNDGFYTKQGDDPDSFTFRAINRAGESETRTARVTTQPDKPTCENAKPAKTPNTVPVEIELPCRGVDFQRAIVTPPEHGTLGEIDQETGKVTYTVNADYFTPKGGPPDRFTFRASNRGGDGAPAEATVTVEPPAPTCEERSDVDVTFETPATVKPSCKGVEMEYAVASQPQHGKLGAIDPSTGAVTYTPDKGYYSPVSPPEPDSFTISDANRTGRATTTIRLRVLPPPPTCENTKLEVNYARSGTVEMTCKSVVKMTGIVVTQNPRNGTLGDGSTSGPGTTLTAKWTYQPNAKFTGDDSFQAAGVGFEGKRGDPATASIKVNAFKLRAIGDSVTAGFGYYGDGSDMGLTKLFSCKPGEIPNDRCSSNSPLGDDSDAKDVKYLDDYGLKNNVSWAAQYANRLGLKAGVGFKNLAVTGSEPVHWVPGGYLNKTLEDVVAENPDMTVLTIGANPLLSMFLLTGKRFECGWTFTEAALKSCVEKYMTEVQMDSRLATIYNRLLDAKDNRVVVSLYPNAAPAIGVQPPLLSYSPWQLDYMEKLINDRIEAAVNKVRGQRGNRLFLSKPERTYFGLPSWYAPNYTCGVPVLHAQTDGYSRQAGIAQFAIVSQVAAYAAPWFSWMVFPPLIAGAAYTYAMTQFCPTTTYWTIEGDTGIHPSKAGYTIYADALQKVANDNKLVPPLP